MFFIFSVAGPAVVLLSGCIAPQLLLIFTFSLAKTRFGSAGLFPVMDIQQVY